MDNHIIEKDGVFYTPFKRGLKAPKLQWVMDKLAEANIRTHLPREQSLSGHPVLYVERGTIEAASHILFGVIASFNVGDTKVAITYDDLPNDHSIFFKELETPDNVQPLPPSDTEVIPHVDMPVTLEVLVTADEVASEIDLSTWAAPEEPEWLESAPTAYPKGTEYLHADEVLEIENVELPSVSKPVKLYNVESSNISALGYRPSSTDDGTGLLYVRFKGGAYYRYKPVKGSLYNDIIGEAVRKAKEEPDAGSVGSLFHNLIKVPADEGAIACQKLDGDAWKNVPTKAQKAARIKERSND